MPDVVDSVPPAIDQKGNTVIWWVPTIASTVAPTVTEIGAATSFRVTHSFTPDGWTIDGDQTKAVDDRLALTTPLESLDTLTYTFGAGVKYVDSSAAGSAAVVLKPTAPATTKTGYFVERRNVSNATLVAASQAVRVLPVTLGPQIPGPVDGSGKFTYKQQVSITGVPVAGVVAV